MVNQRFWRPEGDHTDAVLYPVGAVSSDQRLYVVMEGPAPPPPRFKGDSENVPMLAVRVITAAGEELIASGRGSFGKTGPLIYLWNTPLPPDLSEPFTVQLRREDASIVYEARMIPALP